MSPRSRQSFSSRAMISSLVSSSRLPVGSSASSTLGSLTSARAMATRCCWPPDSSDGRCRARSARPTSASACAARALRLAVLTPSGTRAASTFSCALSVGIRLNVWKMNPMDAARTLVTCPSRISARSWPSNADDCRRSAGPGRRASAAGWSCRARSDPGWRATRRRRSPGRRPAGQRPRCGPSGTSFVTPVSLYMACLPRSASGSGRCQVAGRGAGCSFDPAPAPRPGAAGPPASRRTCRRSGRLPMASTHGGDDRRRA